MAVSRRFEFPAHVFGHQMFFSTTGRRISLRPDVRIAVLSFSVSADDNFEASIKPNVVVQANGSMLFVPPAIYKSICPFNIAAFPFVCLLAHPQRTIQKSSHLGYPKLYIEIRLVDFR